MYKYLSLSLILLTGSLFLYAQSGKNNKFQSDNWKYICIDSTRTIMRSDMRNGAWLFGMDIGDMNGDGYGDVASGKWIYLNPKGKLHQEWHRLTIPDSLDVLFCSNIDDDKYIDMIAFKCKMQFWLELSDQYPDSIKIIKIDEAPICNHGVSSQGYFKADIIKGGKTEFLVTDAPGKIICFQIPENPKSDWPFITITENGSTEKGITAMDIDRDGDMDVVSSSYLGKELVVVWFENPGVFKGGWEKHILGKTNFVCSNLQAADINGDGLQDIVVCEGRYPGLEPDASIFWFENRGNPHDTLSWISHKIVTQYSSNNLSISDIDHDGDFDIVTAEHKGLEKKLQIWENDGKGNFTEHVIDKGKENHLGTRLSDLDNDGDLDMIGFGWEKYQYLHIWENAPLKIKKQVSRNKYQDTRF